MSTNNIRLSIVAGLFAHDRAMTRDFIELARPQWLEAWPFTVQELVTEDGLSGSTYDKVGEFNAASERIHAKLAHAPRGTWARITQRIGTGEVFNDLIMADGLGFVAVVGSWPGEPTPEQAVEKILEGEISLTRQQYREMVKANESAALLNSRGWRIGTHLSNATVGGTRYRQVVIRECRKDGFVLVEATTRNGRRRDTIKCRPGDIEIPEAA